MRSESPPYRLMAPGPVAVPEKVLKALSLPMIHHRTPEFSEILLRVLSRLKQVFQTTHPVMIQTAAGSGGMESALVNTLSPGDEALFIVSGKFGERWANMGRAYGLKVHTLDVEWGQAVKVEEVARALSLHANIKAVFTQACETSTATLHPIKQLGEVVGSHSDCLFIVDAITAVGATPYAMDDWNIDVTVAGSQKAFMLPAGLAFIALSPKAWSFYEKSRLPKFYFDLKKELEANKKGETHFSSAVSLIRALDVVMDDLTGKNLHRQVARCQALSDATRAALKEMNLETFSSAPSPTVTAVKVPDGIDGAKWLRLMEEKYRITVIGGQDHLKGKILRIGHLGYITDEDMIATLEALGHGLQELAPELLREDQIEKALHVATLALKAAPL